MDNEALLDLVEDTINPLNDAAVFLNNKYQRHARHRKANKVLRGLICELYILISNLSVFRTNCSAAHKHLQGLTGSLLQLCTWHHLEPDRIPTLINIAGHSNQKYVTDALIAFVDATFDAQSAPFAKLEGSLKFAANGTSGIDDLKLQDSTRSETLAVK
ncbi:unnamed protein product [Cercospora beticola]|nr:unnamed protein product [Cercospora beticola]